MREKHKFGEGEKDEKYRTPTWINLIVFCQDLSYEWCYINIHKVGNVDQAYNPMDQT
jgi:hypothetical protein